MTFESLYADWQSQKISQVKAAKLLGVSERTFRRYAHRFEEGGSEGLIDKRVSRPSPRRAPLNEIAEVVNTYNARHEGWNVKQFYGRYRETGGKRSYNWVRMQLQDAGAVEKLPRRGLHRTRFERAPVPGIRLHQDGCRHEWLPDRRCDLVVTMDDATGTHYSIFLCEQEGTWSSLVGIRQVVERKGLFYSLYTDRALHYWSKGKAKTTARPEIERLTQFEGAMGRLGVKLIASRSEAVRARCRRALDIHTECIPAELAAAGITDIAGANRYLQDVYRRAYNEKFEQVAQAEGSGFAPCPNPEQLDDVLCGHYWRIVRADNCVRFNSQLLTLPNDRLGFKFARTWVSVRHHLDDTVSISWGLRRLARYDLEGNMVE